MIFRLARLIINKSFLRQKLIVCVVCYCACCVMQMDSHSPKRKEGQWLRRMWSELMIQIFQNQAACNLNIIVNKLRGIGYFLFMSRPESFFESDSCIAFDVCPLRNACFLHFMHDLIIRSFQRIWYTSKMKKKKKKFQISIDSFNYTNKTL